MKELHLFYVESNFHLIIAEGFIENEDIKKADCLFVTHRGVRLPKTYSDCLLYDGTISQFKERVHLYKKNKKYYNELFKNRRVYSYAPFQFLFPTIRYFSEYNLMEEGFSAYSVPKVISNAKAIRYELFKALYINLLFPFASKNVKGFLMGMSYSSPKAKRQTSLLVSNAGAYEKIDLGKKVRKVVVPINRTEDTTSIKGQIIIVLDRLSKKGRPFDDNTYLSVLKDVMTQLGYKANKILVKLHPADSRMGIEAKSRVEKLLNDIGITPIFIDTNLEEVALSNAHNTFIGTNSTLLYYAPVFGKTNKSISFSRVLSNADEQYSHFLEKWGGTERFCELFSKQVKCL